MGKKKNRVPVTLVEPEQNKCGFCGHVGPKDEFVVDPETDQKYTNWHCLPRIISGNTDGFVAVCQPCAFKHSGQFRKDYPEWFQDHDRLPMLAKTLEMEQMFLTQWTNASQYMESFAQEHNIRTDESRKCKVCGRYHGEVYEREPFPRLNLRITLVNHVVGFHKPREVIMANLCCQDCIGQFRGKEQIFFFDQTMKVLERREKHEAHIARLPGPEKIVPARIDFKPVDPKYLPRDVRTGKKRPWGQATRFTGTHGR
jgi:protein-arginine kinase activator protein McsA